MIVAQPSAEEVERAIADLNLALRTHGGAVECTGFDSVTVNLRMAGLCAGCLFKPVTTAATIGPFIAERLGLQVQVEGARISEEAEQRLIKAFQSSELASLRLAEPAGAAAG
jgi:Fe-S cluster biogenesis protein NfuA